MKKIVSLLIAMVFSLSISAFVFAAETKPAADASSTKVEEKKAEPTTKKKATKKKSKKTKKAPAKKEAEKAPEQPAEKK